MFQVDCVHVVGWSCLADAQTDNFPTFMIYSIHQIVSLILVAAPFFMTDLMPYSIAAALLYDSLHPMIR